MVSEVNTYLSTHSQTIELKDQVTKQVIPLSNGKQAIITTELKKIDPTTRSSLMDAKLGKWDLKQSYDLGLNSTGSLSCKLNVTYVPSTCDGTMTKFQCSAPQIFVTPGYGYTVADKGIELNVITQDYEYSMPGYAVLSGRVGNANFYPTMDVVFAGNTQSTYTKIQVDFYFR